MRIALRELRSVLWIELQESIDLARIAKRAAKSNRSLVQFHSPFGSDDCIALLDGDDNVVGGITASRTDDGFYRVGTLWASQPADAVMLLMSALSVWKKIDPSKQVSPAARAIIKRYYEQHKDDPARVKKHIRSYSPTTDPQYLVAGYLDAGDFDASPILTHEDNKNMIWSLYRAVSDGFAVAYDDDKRTGFSDLTRIAKEGDMMQLAKALVMTTEPPNAAYKKEVANKWLDAHPDYISKMFQVINRTMDADDPEYGELMDAFGILGIA